uniref:Uncharacterized protein n=1 Tax=Triticum urartu TaxID=4572 RepID=A0A8R7UHY3_TRIUA
MTILNFAILLVIFWYFIAGDIKCRVVISNFYFDMAGCSSSTYLVYALLSTYQQEDKLNASPWQSAAVNVLVLLDLNLLNGSVVIYYTYSDRGH